MTADRAFDAQAFNENLPGGRCAGRLAVRAGQLHFEGAGEAVDLPLAGLQLSLGGASDRLVFITHPALPAWQLYTSDHALLAESALAEHPAVQRLRQHRRKRRLLGWGSLATVLGLIVLLPLALYFSLDGLSAVVARRLPADWEQSLGETAIKQFRVQKTFMPDKTAEALLKPLVAPLVAQAGDRYRYHFHVINDPSLNAFALPGGEVVIHSGLILKATSPDQLQGVLAHEISHVTEQHGLRSVIKSVGVYAVAQALIGDASGLIAAVAGAAPMLINQKYSRDFEREADRAGFDLLARAQINPAGLIGFFRTIREEERKQLKQLGDADAQDAARGAMAYLGTHPDTDERIAKLQARLAKLPAQTWRDDRAAFAALKAQVQAFVKTPE
ncbi:M48 family metallopeptidase [Niveibacterium sp.]|uniref:M48 family metallopeptidase n=1 Tax=Niveibacterium sp. TaxID=2017444 RepID=UPI0035B2145F